MNFNTKTDKICHNCKGKGIVTAKNKKRKGVCYYCRGKGIKYSNYGRDRP